MPGSCCHEMDIWEANKISNAVTPHVCVPGNAPCTTDVDCGAGDGNRYKGFCDRDGCDFNPCKSGKNPSNSPWLIRWRSPHGQPELLRPEQDRRHHQAHDCCGKHIDRGACVVQLSDLVSRLNSSPPITPPTATSWRSAASTSRTARSSVSLRPTSPASPATLSPTASAQLKSPSSVTTTTSAPRVA